MDYSLITSGVVFLFVSAMTDVNDNFGSKVLFKVLPLFGAVIPIIAGLDGIGII